MSHGLSFIDMLVSPITPVFAVVIFLLCCWLLLFKRKSISSGIKTLAVFGLVITVIYFAFIIWAVIGWGSH